MSSLMLPITCQQFDTLQNVCSLLRVRSGEEIVSRISEMQKTLSCRDQLEKVVASNTASHLIFSCIIQVGFEPKAHAQNWKGN